MGVLEGENKCRLKALSPSDMDVFNDWAEEDVLTDNIPMRKGDVHAAIVPGVVIPRPPKMPHL